MLNTAKVPKELEPLFLAAQTYVETYFQARSENSSQGTIEISDQRYILVRGASLSVDLFEMMQQRYRQAGEQEAIDVARSFLFDIAHTIGQMDARSFHKKMDVQDPIEKLSIGPIHFAHTGWAFVDISPESRPTPDENFYLLYDHPFSFESDAWIQASKQPDFPVCVMNAGYSSGWCEESFGIPLLATEVTCKARGDDACRFIMAHPTKIEQAVHDYLQKEPEIAKQVSNYQIPDLSKRKQVEETLRFVEEENRRLAAVASHTHNSVMILTPEGHIDWVNQGFTHVNGYTLDQIRGQSLLTFLKNHLTESDVLEWVTIHIHNRLGGQREMSRLTHSGKQVWLEAEIRPILDAADNLTSIILLETDITERKEAQEYQDQLLEDLEKANRELNDFAHIVSHDLKAPLRAINNIATWISEDCKDHLPQENREQLDLLTGRVEQMQKLLEGILLYSRAGRAEEPAECVDLNELVVDVIDMLAPPETITITPSDHLPTLRLERTRIQQVFQNLISNAIKYMDKAEGRIIIDAVEYNEHWQFNVIDNGPGIEEKYFDQIFDMFKTLNTRDDVDSSGVGLTVVKKIVEYYGGKIHIESKVGEGSTFTFTLPKKRLACEDATSTKAFSPQP